MIRFSLTCEHEHDFEGWFGSSDDFATQSKRGLVTCPVCNSASVEKSLMAPSVSTSRAKETMAVANMDQAQKAVLNEMRKLRDMVTENADDVGDKFPEEARKIHYGEAEQRGIYGKANRDDVQELLEEGVEIAPLPVLPDDAN